jgi:hypothetical protein
MSTAAYMLLFRDSTPEVYTAMTDSEREAALRDWNAWHDGLAAAGKVQHAHPLEPGGRVVSAARGGPIKDGPFLEAKEAIGGYFFLTVDSLDEATEIARNCPNLKNGMVVEVRPVSGACPLAQSLGLQAMR